MDMLVSSLVYPVFGVLIYYVFEVLYKRYKSSRGTKVIPCGTLMPILGNVWIFLNVKTVTELHRKIAGYMADSPLAGFWIANKLLVLVNEPKYVDAIISRTWASQKDKDSYGAFRIFSDGVFSRHDDNWARLRRPLMNLVHHKFIDSWVDVFSRRTEKLCEAIKAQQGPFEIAELTHACTLDLICETHMGAVGVSELKGDQFRFREMLTKALELSFKLMLNPAYRLGLGNLFFGSEVKKLENLLQLPHYIVQKRVRALAKKDVDISTVEPTNYTDVVIQAGIIEGADDRQLAKIAVDMLVAGSDTTGTAMSSAILFLAMHPQYQEQAYKELVDICGTSDRVPTDDDLRKMVYLDMVIHETVRIVGVPGISRTLDKEAEIDGYVLPKGTAVFLRFMTINRDPRWWKNPKGFFPDHFLPEEVAARPKGAFTPFSAGQRSCPGQLYAMVSMKTVLSTLIRRFRFSTDLKFKEISYAFQLMQEPECTRVTATPRT